MKKLISAIAFLIFIGCNQNTKKKENSELSESTMSSNKLAINTEHEKVNYDIIEEFIGQEGLYKFKAPKGLFKRNSENEFISESLNAKIKFTFIQTDRFDEKGVFSKKDLIDLYKSKIKTTYFVDKNDWFVLSGTDAENKIIYLKGFYEELISMQGRDDGELTWLWSKSGILEFQYADKNKEEFDKLIPFIIKSFKCDFSVL